jgi:hypothetical protein
MPYSMLQDGLVAHLGHSMQRPECRRGCSQAAGSQERQRANLLISSRRVSIKELRR